MIDYLGFKYGDALHIFGNSEPGHCASELRLGYLNAQIYGQFYLVFIDNRGFGNRPADFNRVCCKDNFLIGRLRHRHNRNLARVGLFALCRNGEIVNAYRFIGKRGDTVFIGRQRIVQIVYILFSVYILHIRVAAVKRDNGAGNVFAEIVAHAELNRTVLERRNFEPDRNCQRYHAVCNGNGILIFTELYRRGRRHNYIKRKTFAGCERSLARLARLYEGKVAVLDHDISHRGDTLICYRNGLGYGKAGIRRGGNRLIICVKLRNARSHTEFNRGGGGSALYRRELNYILRGIRAVFIRKEVECYREEFAR